MRPRVAALCLAAVLSAVSARAAWQSSISAADFNVPPYPADDSQELQTILQDQQTRSQADCQLGSEMVNPTFTALFTPSGILSSSGISQVQPFMDQIDQAVDSVDYAFKKQFARPRPYAEDSEIHPCVSKPSGATSYPSEHATEGAAQACVLAKLFPDRAAQLLAWGKKVGDLRVIVGVHHPSDVAAGQQLGADICSWLFQQSDFVSQEQSLAASLTGN